MLGCYFHCICNIPFASLEKFTLSFCSSVRPNQIVMKSKVAHIIYFDRMKMLQSSIYETCRFPDDYKKKKEKLMMIEDCPFVVLFDISLE